MQDVYRPKELDELDKLLEIWEPPEERTFAIEDYTICYGNAEYATPEEAVEHMLPYGTDDDKFLLEWGLAIGLQTFDDYAIFYKYNKQNN